MSSGKSRQRLWPAIVIPFAALAGIAALTIGFAVILLSLSPASATLAALIVGLVVLLAGAQLARGRHSGVGSIALMTGVFAGVAALAGGLILVLGGERKIEAHGGEKPPAGPVVEVVAKDLAFTPTELSVPAGQAFTIAFDNQDAGIPHNVRIFDGPKTGQGEVVFDGELITGPAKVEYHVDPLPEGTFGFDCKVHPTMIGTIKAGPATAPGGGGPAKLVEVAKNLAFQQKELTAPTGVPIELTLDNQDAGVPHDIVIFPGPEPGKGEPVFAGEQITGVTSITYKVEPLDPGEYGFHCSIHPTMVGTLVVKARAGPGDARGRGTPEPNELKQGSDGTTTLPA